MSESILDSTKKKLGLAEDYDVFDSDVIDAINTALSTLTQLGLGPAEGFAIEDSDPTWDTFLGNDPRFISAKTFVFLKAKLAFDIPGASFHVAAIEKQITELEWRLSVARDENMTYLEVVDL